MSVIPSRLFSTTAEPRDRDCELLDPAALDSRRVFYVCKRYFDFLLALAMLVFLLPLWLLIAILIKIDSSGSVLFVNPAVGQHGREFLLYKFRSMHPATRMDTQLADVTRNMRQGTPTTYLEGRAVYKSAFADYARITRVG